MHRPASSLLISKGADAQNAGHSDDERGHFRGSDVGRSDSGEVEMMEFERQGLPRRSSASTLDEQAGTRAGDEACLHHAYSMQTHFIVLLVCHQASC